MPESTMICPNCGNQLEPNPPACPYCGVEFLQPEPAPGGIAGVLYGIRSVIAAHPRYWMAGGGVFVAAVAAAVVVFGGFLGPSGKQICTASLNLARDYGVISPSATLASDTAKSTDVDGRRSCTAQADGETFTLLADLKKKDAKKKPCKNFEKQDGCVALWSVARSDGMTTYQVRTIPPDQTDEALAAKNPPAAQDTSADGSDQDASGFGAATAVDNSSTIQTAPAPQQQQ